MPRLNPIPLLLLAIAVPVSAQTARPADVAPVRQAIDAGNAAYIAAFKRADAKALSQVYDPEGARFNEGGVVIRGRDAIADDVGKFVERVGPVSGDPGEQGSLADGRHRLRDRPLVLHLPAQGEGRAAGSADTT